MAERTELYAAPHPSPETDRPAGATASLPRSGPGAPPAATEPAPQPSQRYELLGELARGGMGVVYRAADRVFDREVAVKILAREAGGGSPVTLRFVEEARITGQLQHPGIPPVHDLGTLPDGRPFLAMRLIKGQTLESLLRGRADAAAERLRFLTVFGQVCQAVAYAHEHNVIHRDLKPANVMVGAFGEVHVMDWGLAKVLPDRADQAAERTEPGSKRAGDGTVIRSVRDSGPVTPGSGDAPGALTQAGTVLGTPSYMAPEQAGGEVDRLDERCDVFGLGAMLCEILTGKPPYLGTTANQVCRKAMAADLSDATARLDACGADREWVELCRRCLAAEPGARPSDASEVAAAVSGHLSAIEGRLRLAEQERASAEARAAEQRKRRKTQRALALTIGLLVVGAGAVAWWADRRAEAERGRLDRNAQVVESLIGQGEDSLRADDEAPAAVQLDLAGRRLAEGGAEDLRPRFDRLSADLAVLRDLNRLDELRWTATAGRVTSDADLAKAAEAAFRSYGFIPGETAPDAVARLVNESPVRERALTALDLWLGWARSEDVAVSDRQAAALRAADPDPYRGAVRDATRAGRQPALRQLGEQPAALTQPAWFAAVLGQRPAIPADRREQILRAAHVRRPNDLTLLIPLGKLAQGGGKERAGDAIGWFRAAVAARPGSVVAWNQLGVALGMTGDLAGAEAALREALRLNPKALNAQANLGNVLQGRGDLAGAEAAYREAVRLDPTRAVPHFNLGVALFNRRDRAGAEAEFREAARLDPYYAPAQMNLWQVLRLGGDLDGAIAHFREVLGINPKTVSALNALGTALLERGDLDEAVSAFREAGRLEPGNQDARSGLQQGERLLALLTRLPDLAAGRERPKSPAEAVDLARLCATPAQKRYALAVRLYDEAFAADPKVANDLIGGHRFAAARSAVLVAAGMDGELPKVELAERERLTGLSLKWMRADLDQMTTRGKNPKWHQWVWERLTQWKADPDLAPVRYPAGLAAMPPDKSEAWRAHWREVDALFTTVTR
jgi:serine/threonine protein kinase/tetratricopeptide (TPR) repeat protein